jgi:hypothetical protein
MCARKAGGEKPRASFYDDLYGEMLQLLKKADSEDSDKEGYFKMVLIVRDSIGRLGEVSTTTFPDRNSEVGYFRDIWPKFYAQLFYYLLLHCFEMGRISLSAEELPSMITREEKKVAGFFSQYREFWQYYRSGSPVVATQFTREYSISCVLDPLCLVVDPMGATLASYRAAWGLAMERYGKWLEEKQRGLTQRGGLMDVEGYSWAYTDADFVEWIFGLQAAGAIRYKGEPADISRLQKWSKQALGKEVVNIYDRFKVIRNRKKDRMPFSKRAMNALEKRMDTAEGKFEK